MSPPRPRIPLQTRRPRPSDEAVILSAEEIALVKSLVIYEDEHILALNKPAGLSSQGGRGQVHTLDELLWAFAKKSGQRPRLVHRLDRDTSGVILTGKTKPAAGFLGKAVMARKFEKTYLALVGGGAPVPASGTVVAALRREEDGREAYMRACADDHADAQASQTVYRTLKADAEAALVECKPVTGRMHQIRVHMSHLGRPILGDVRYGGALTLGGHRCGRVMLHAQSLIFPHPDGGQKRLTAEPPADFQAVLAEIGA